MTSEFGTEVFLDPLAISASQMHSKISLPENKTPTSNQDHYKQFFHIFISYERVFKKKKEPSHHQHKVLTVAALHPN